MTTQRIRSLFEAALRKPVKERRSYIEQHCQDSAVRDEVLELLKHHDCADTFLELPASARYETLFHTQITRIGEFEIVSEIGRGGMGVVYLANDTILGRRVALKVLAPHLTGSESSIARFRHEAKAIAALNHKGIIPIYRYGNELNLHYIVMEFIDGETFATQLRKSCEERTSETERRREELNNDDETHSLTESCSPQDPSGSVLTKTTMSWRRERLRKAATVISQVADALEHAHQNGVIHRDVKPSNIIIDVEGYPHLTDFGIAKFGADQAFTMTGNITGTAYYMSPEQAQQARTPIDHRSDIFSLGVVLYEALSLRRPFEGDSTPQVLDAIRRHDPRRLRTIHRSVPRDLETICHKALEKRLIDRYQSASQMAADLRSWLSGNPILARPPSLRRRLIRWITLHRFSTVLMLSTLLVILTIGLAIALRSSHRDRTSWLTVKTPHASLTLLLQRVNPESLEFGPINSQQLDRSTQILYLTPGLYRVTVIPSGDAKGTFAETDLRLLNPGHDHQWTLVLGGDGPSVIHNPKTRFIPIPEGLPNTDGMAHVLAGEYMRGSGDSNRAIYRVQNTWVDAFMVDQRETSNAEYLRFLYETSPSEEFTAYLNELDDKNRPTRDAEDAPPPSPLIPAYWHMIGYDPALANHPAVGMTIESAHAYASWYGKRLLTISEWEAAARGTDGHKYPHGLGHKDLRSLDPSHNTLRSKQARELLPRFELYRTQSVPVDTPDPYATANGIEHLFDNAREMVSTIEPDNTDGIEKGRCWGDVVEFNNLSKSWTFPYASPYFSRGFRCARSTNRISKMSIE